MGLTALIVATATLIAACSSQTETASEPETEAVETAAETSAEGEVLTGTAEGFGGDIIAEVIMDGDTIVGLTLTGDDETPDVGGAALPVLQEEILANGSIDGVDGVSGATWTSNGVFAAIEDALGITSEVASEEAAGETISASGLYHGLGVVATGRLGPGTDDQDVGVYCFNDAVAYVLFDEDGRILDLEVDQLEVSTPNYDGEYMPNFTGWPGQSYNADEDHDEVVETVLTQDEDSFMAEVETWKTKRDRGNTYKLNSGIWADEMDIFENAMIGMTIDELQEWYDTCFSESTGRALTPDATSDEDIAKYEALSDDQKASLDAVSGATMSLSDSHGDLLGAIVKAYDNRVPVEAESISGIGLGYSVSGRIGPGTDSEDVSIYCFNVQFSGACYDADGNMAGLYTDVMEVSTPNYDGEYMPNFTGWPGQSYNADEDHDDVVDAVLDQTEDSFMEEVDTWRTKRERGSTYKLNSGTWDQEMDIFEAFFAGKSAEDIEEWYDSCCSDVNGKVLDGSSENEEDIAKYDAMSDSQKEEIDALSGATISLNDSHGDLIGSILDTWDNFKAADIVVN